MSSVMNPVLKRPPSFSPTRTQKYLPSAAVRCKSVLNITPLKKRVVFTCVCVCLCVRSGDVPVRGLVQPPAGPAEPPQQGHQERGQDRAQLISFLNLKLQLLHRHRDDLH